MDCPSLSRRVIAAIMPASGSSSSTTGASGTTRAHAGVEHARIGRCRQERIRQIVPEVAAKAVDKIGWGAAITRSFAARTSLRRVGQSEVLDAVRDAARVMHRGSRNIAYLIRWPRRRWRASRCASRPGAFRGTARATLPDRAEHTLVGRRAGSDAQRRCRTAQPSIGQELDRVHTEQVRFEALWQRQRSGDAVHLRNVHHVDPRRSAPFASAARYTAMRAGGTPVEDEVSPTRADGEAPRGYRFVVAGRRRRYHAGHEPHRRLMKEGRSAAALSRPTIPPTGDAVSGPIPAASSARLFRRRCGHVRVRRRGGSAPRDRGRRVSVDAVRASSPRCTRGRAARRRPEVCAKTTHAAAQSSRPSTPRKSARRQKMTDFQMCACAVFEARDEVCGRQDRSAG